MAPSESTNIPLAPVQRWNSQTVRVRCPYCKTIHTHDFGGSYADDMRTPLCGSVSALSYPPYRLTYPFSTEDGTVAYEIDKSAGFFVRLGVSASKSKVESIEKGLDSLNLNASGSAERRSWDEATEMTTIGPGDEMLRRVYLEHGGEDTSNLKRLWCVLGQMIFHGDSEYVDDYIRTSHEAELFLHGVDGQGDSALIIAAREPHPDIVKLLLDHGANPDHQNKEDRTAMMEAALWGRLYNVTHLLARGANKKLCDIHGRQAAELAGPSIRNSKERYERSGGEHPVYREITYTANQSRRAIVELLKDPEVAQARETIAQDTAFPAYSFRKTDRGTIEFVAEFPVKNEYKTIAILHRSSNYPLIAAMSGWGHTIQTVTVPGGYLSLIASQPGAPAASAEAGGENRHIATPGFQLV